MPATAATVTEDAKLLASDAAAEDRFGCSVSVSGDTAVVGAGLDDDNGTNSGSAYVFVRSGSVWTEQAKLLPGDGAAPHRFGCSVSVSRDTAVVGAYSSDGIVADSGSAYVFVRSGTVWSQQAKLTASDGAAWEYFGCSVSLSGDTAVVGAYGDDDNGTNWGLAYVFVRSGSIWTEQAKLTASDGAADALFGESVSVSGDTAVVAANSDHDNGGPGRARRTSSTVRGTRQSRPSPAAAPSSAGEPRRAPAVPPRFCWRQRSSASPSDGGDGSRLSVGAQVLHDEHRDDRALRGSLRRVHLVRAQAGPRACRSPLSAKDFSTTKG